MFHQSQKASLCFARYIECDWSHNRVPMAIAWAKSKSQEFKRGQIESQERALTGEVRSNLEGWTKIRREPWWPSWRSGESLDGRGKPISRLLHSLLLGHYLLVPHLKLNFRDWEFWTNKALGIGLGNSPLQRPLEVEKGWHTLLDSCQSFPSGQPAKWKQSWTEGLSWEEHTWPVTGPLPRWSAVEMEARRMLVATSPWKGLSSRNLFNQMSSHTSSPMTACSLLMLPGSSMANWSAATLLAPKPGKVKSGEC